MRIRYRMDTLAKNILKRFTFRIERWAEFTFFTMMGFAL